MVSLSFSNATSFGLPGAYSYTMEIHARRKRIWSPDDATEASVLGDTQQITPEAEIAKRARLSTGESITQQITIHRVRCPRTQRNHASHPPSFHYVDTPAMVASDNQSTALHGQFPLRDVDNYLDENFGFSIVVFVDYDCEIYHAKIKDAFTRLPMPSMPHDMNLGMKPFFRVLQHDGPIAEAITEQLQLSETLEEALHALQSQSPEMPSEWNFDNDLIYPYPKLYHCHHIFVGPLKQNLDSQQQTDLQVLSSYINERLTSEYERMEELAATGMVDRKHWMMLFLPDDTVITLQEGQYRAFTVKSCRLVDENTLEMACWSWEYDGNFFQNHIMMPVKWPSRSKQVAITDISVYPVRYAAEGIESALRNRGNTFWSCRRRKYVNYDMPLQGLGTQLVRL